MPDEIETREVDGKEEVCFKGEWLPMKKPKPKQKKEYPLSVEVKIGNRSLKGHGRADEFKWKDKQGNERIRRGYAIKIDQQVAKVIYKDLPRDFGGYAILAPDFSTDWN